MDDNLPAESIVPIAVVVDERTGYTLWAPPWEEDDGEEWQAFLGTGGLIHLFSTPGQLAHFVGTDAEHDLTDHPACRSGSCPRTRITCSTSMRCMTSLLAVPIGGPSVSLRTPST
jgi:hypothetical protein